MVRLLPELIELALLIFCVIECIQAPEGEIRNLPRWGWLVLIILVPIIGSVAWLVAGRPQRAGGPRRSAPWPSTRTAGYPEYERPARGPDDDTEFLSGLKRADTEHEDVLRKWEEDLRRREEKLSGPDATPSTADDQDPPPVIS